MARSAPDPHSGRSNGDGDVCALKAQWVALYPQPRPLPIAVGRGEKRGSRAAIAPFPPHHPAL
jgi:hypothetical protein